MPLLAPAPKSGFPTAFGGETRLLLHAGQVLTVAGFHIEPKVHRNSENFLQRERGEFWGATP